MRNVIRGAWCVGFLLLVACGDMGSGYTAEQIMAIQQGTPVNAVLTAFPVTYAPTRPASVGVGGVEQPAVQAQWTVEAATRVAGEGTRVSDAATRGSGEATRASVELTQDAAAFQQELASANVDLNTQEQLAALQVTVAYEVMTATLQALEKHASIDDDEVASSSQSLFWFEQVQQAEAEKALSQARFWETARYVAMVGAVALMGAGLYWWFWLRPRNEVRVVTVNGKDMAMVKTPNGYAPIITSMQARLPETTHDEETQPDSPVPPTLPTLVELPDIERDVLKVGVFENGAPMHLGSGFRGILVTGEPGSGKSTFLRQLVAQALLHGWLIYLADGEQITFQPNLWGEVAKSQAEMVEWLKWLKGDVVDKRHELYRRVSALIEDQLPPAQQFLVEDLNGYNRAAQMFNLPIMRPLLIGWDEANKTLGDKNVQVLFDDLAQSARKVGGELIVSGHDWRATQIPKGSSSYLPCRVAFRSEKTSSEVVLRGDSSAMHIPYNRKGLAYVQMNQWRGFMQGYFLPDARLIQMVREMRPREAVLSEVPWRRAIPAEVDMSDLIDESQAEQDAQLLLDSYDRDSYKTRRQVAIKLCQGAGKKGDDPGDYARGDEALKVLVQQGVEWARKVLMTDARYAA